MAELFDNASALTKLEARAANCSELAFALNLGSLLKKYALKCIYYWPE
jgi:hypothetical protein